MTGTIDKVVLITGASSGIGEATTCELAAAGAGLFIGARRTERLKALADELGERVAWHELDTDGRCRLRWFRSRCRRTVWPDRRAGQQRRHHAALNARSDRDEWKRMIDVNIHGVLNGIAAVLPRFVAQENGHVINVASIAARMVMPSSSVYSATKHAVRVITDGLRQEHSNIRATLISPGTTTTELGHDVTDPDIAAMLRKSMPTGQPPVAIAQAIRYALEQPYDVDVSKMVVSPTASPL
jgi:NADP-dependent 3-hydroxy acid dehydrogenase YdfG